MTMNWPTDVVTDAEPLVPVDGPDAGVAQGESPGEPGKLEESRTEVQRCSTDQAVAVLVVLVIVGAARPALGGRPARVEDEQRRHRQSSHILTHNHQAYILRPKIFPFCVGFWLLEYATRNGGGNELCSVVWLTAGSGKNMPHL